MIDDQFDGSMQVQPMGDEERAKHHNGTGGYHGSYHKSGAGGWSYNTQGPHGWQNGNYGWHGGGGNQHASNPFFGGTWPFLGGLAGGLLTGSLFYPIWGGGYPGYGYGQGYQPYAPYPPYQPVPPYYGWGK